MKSIPFEAAFGFTSGSVHRFAPWLLALAVPFVVIEGTGWLRMWLAAAALWFACKLTMVRGLANPLRGKRLLGYWLLWPGMDPKPFVEKIGTRPQARVFPGALCVVLGAALILLSVAWALPERPLLGGWMAWCGLILALHFGVFHLLAVVWQRCGIPVVPLMDKPWAARSLADFWSRRWNHAFQEVAHRLLFRPVAKRGGPVAATGLVFLASGLVHELVITVPAGGAYGGPTLYFLAQGFGLLAERRLKFTDTASRLFAWVVVLGPVPLLFPPPFIERVIVPALGALTATLR